MRRNRRTRPERKLIRLPVEEVVGAEGEVDGEGEVVCVVVVEEAVVEEVEVAGEGVVEGDSRPFKNTPCAKA